MSGLEKAVYNKRRPHNLRLEERRIVGLTIHRGDQSLIGEATETLVPKCSSLSTLLARRKVLPQAFS